MSSANQTRKSPNFLISNWLFVILLSPLSHPPALWEIVRQTVRRVAPQITRQAIPETIRRAVWRAIRETAGKAILPAIRKAIGKALGRAVPRIAPEIVRRIAREAARRMARQIVRRIAGRTAGPAPRQTAWGILAAVPSAARTHADHYFSLTTLAQAQTATARGDAGSS